MATGNEIHSRNSVMCYKHILLATDDLKDFPILSLLHGRN